SVFASLMLLYVVTSVSASVLGGIIEHFLFPEATRFSDFSPNNVFSDGFYGSGFHRLATSILSRFPVNLIDRAIVVFGGYFIALGIRKLCGAPVLGDRN
ncbi:MAG: hypothetical protein FWE09_03285, partial [Treponema sp.]|nr:hypothetical protein [Treponema sp.]